MKLKNSIIALATLAVASAFAETTPDYTAVDAARHIGETATVTDKVDGVLKAKGGSIFLNMGGAHPNEAFTAFIPGNKAEQFADFAKYDGATVTVSGKIVSHEGKPEIVVNSPDQITIKEAAPEKKDKPSPSSN